MAEFIVSQTGREKLVREDAVQVERKFADPFVCPICVSVAEHAIQCGNCKQIFDRECIHNWLEGDANCTACKNPFQLEELNRNLVNMFGFIRFNCKFCNCEFRFSERRTHLLTCAGVKLSTCAFGCTNVTASMMDHMKNQC